MTTPRLYFSVAAFAVLFSSMTMVGTAGGTASAADPAYQPLPAPQRVLDTRPGSTTADGQFAGTGAQAADSTLALTVAGRVGVPADASAVVLNVTAVDPRADGFLTVFPCGAQRPVASNVNYYAGTSVPNAVIAKIGAGGDVCIYTLSDTDLAVDVQGVLPAGSYAPLDAPQRLLDTRPGSVTADGQFAGVGQQAAGTAITLDVAGRVGIPADAPAVVLNVTAVDPTDLGFLSVYPCGEPTPNASNVNYYPGTTVPNAVIAKIGAGGDVCIFTRVATDIVVDVAGVLPASVFTALANPQRLVDTRPGGQTADGQMSGVGLLPAGSSLQLRVGGRVGVPLDASAVVLNVTAVDPTAPGFLTVYPAGAQQPLASNVNYYGGRTVANTVIAKLGTDASACIFTLAATHVVVDVAGYLAGEPPVDTGTGCTEPVIAGPTALDLLAGIPIAQEQPVGFDRTLFNEWVDVDGDGCDTEELVWIRDSLDPPTLNVHCEAVTGRWYSPYDGLTWTQATDITIDHVVSLKEAWDSGAHAWTPERRTAFGNDLLDDRTLRVVSAAIDDQKQTNDPANWMPPLESDWCRFLSDYISIKARWGLSMDQNESDEIRDMLTTRCADVRVAAWPVTPA